MELLAVIRGLEAIKWQNAEVHVWSDSSYVVNAINKGWLEPEPYVGQTLLAWHYVNAHITANGQVEGTCVGTGLAFDPAFYAYRPVNNYAAHGYGPVIWAGAEIICLLDSLCIKTNDSAVHFYPEDPGTDEPIFYVK